MKQTYTKDEMDARVAAELRVAAEICSGKTLVKRNDRPAAILARITADARAAYQKALAGAAVDAAARTEKAMEPEIQKRIANAVEAERKRYTNCCICGRVVDTFEKVEGGDDFGCELESEGAWVCSSECYDRATRDVKE